MADMYIDQCIDDWWDDRGPSEVGERLAAVCDNPSRYDISELQFFMRNHVHHMSFTQDEIDRVDEQLRVNIAAKFEDIE